MVGDIGCGGYGRGGSCCNDQVLPSGSLNATKEPQGVTSTSLAATLGPVDVGHRDRYELNLPVHGHNLGAHAS
jgi:hypothetical protein